MSGLSITNSHKTTVINGLADCVHVPYFIRINELKNKGKEKKLGFLAKKCKEYFYIPLKISNFAVRNKN